MIDRQVDPSDKIPYSTSWTRRKDRHSKVVTLKGLRDRRVRLSVPTALQLYDLQHKLGLDQPSKVVEWLLKEAEHEIDKLRKDEETIMVSDEDGVKLDAPNLDLIKGNTFNLGPSYQNDFISRSVSGSHHGVEEIQNLNVMAALPSTMPLSSQEVVYSPAGLPQYFFHPQ